MCKQHPNSKERESMITRAIITQPEKEEKKKKIVCVVKEGMMAFMPYENDVHIKHLLLCLHFLRLKNILVIERFY
jgi:hypothetical protein